LRRITIVRSTKVFPIFRLFIDGKIIVWPWAMILSSRNNLNMETLLLTWWNNWRNQFLTIVMSPKQICYLDLGYILQINYEYGLLFCLPQIINSRIEQFSRNIYQDVLIYVDWVSIFLVLVRHSDSVSAIHENGFLVRVAQPKSPRTCHSQYNPGVEHVS
jgi:hypothetical protein